MTDYTPTLGEVKAAWIICEREVNPGHTVDELTGWFDRWLAEFERAAAGKALTEASASIDTHTTAPSDYWRGHLDGRLNAQKAVDGYASAAAYRREETE